MLVKVPNINRCCFLLPLRQGIVLFAYLNIVLSVLIVTCLVITTELQRASITQDESVESVTLTVLFSILGMGVILNFLLLIAGYQKDVLMLRLYNYYSIPTTLAALVPAFILLSREMYLEFGFSLVAIVLQVYVIILVRSEVIKLEEMTIAMAEERLEDIQEPVEISDRVTLV